MELELAVRRQVTGSMLAKYAKGDRAEKAGARPAGRALAFCWAVLDGPTGKRLAPALPFHLAGIHSENGNEFNQPPPDPLGRRPPDHLHPLPPGSQERQRLRRAEELVGHPPRRRLLPLRHPTRAGPADRLLRPWAWPRPRRPPPPADARRGWATPAVVTRGDVDADGAATPVELHRSRDLCVDAPSRRLSPFRAARNPASGSGRTPADVSPRIRTGESRGR